MKTWDQIESALVASAAAAVKEAQERFDKHHAKWTNKPTFGVEESFVRKSVRAALDPAMEDDLVEIATQATLKQIRTPVKVHKAGA